MASAYGIARTYTQFVPPMDLNLFAQAMQTKQGKYDQNYQYLASKIDFLKNVDIVKAEDKDYFIDRTNKIIETVNNYGADVGLDISNKGVATQLDTYINQAVDKKVINAMTSTSKYRKFVGDMDVLKEKHPDKYNGINEAYALRPFVEYMNDGKVGSELKDLSYNPYVDVDAKYQKVFKEYLASRGKEKIDSVNPNDPYALFSDEYYGLEKDRLQNMIDKSLTPEEVTQLGINGWYKLGMANKEQAVTIRDSYLKAADDEIDSKLSIYESKLKTETNPQYVEQLKRVVTDLKTKKQSYDNLRGANTPESIGFILEKENLIGSLSSLYQKELVSREIKENKPYTTRIEHGFRQMELSLSSSRLNLDQQKFEFDKVKYSTEQAQKEQEAQQNKANLIVPVNPTSEQKSNINLYDESVGKLNKERDKIYGTMIDGFEGTADELKVFKGIAVNKSKENGTDYVFELAQAMYAKDRNKYADVMQRATEMNFTKGKMVTEVQGMVKQVMKTNPNLSEEQWAQKFAYNHTISSSDEEKTYYETMLVGLGKTPAQYIPEFRKQFAVTSRNTSPYTDPVKGAMLPTEISKDKYVNATWYQYTGIDVPVSFLKTIGEIGTVDKSFDYKTNSALYRDALTKAYTGDVFNNDFAIKGGSELSGRLSAVFNNAPTAELSDKVFTGKGDLTLKKDGNTDNYFLVETAVNSKGESISRQSKPVPKTQLGFLQDYGVDLQNRLNNYSKEYQPAQVVSTGFPSFGDRVMDRDEYLGKLNSSVVDNSGVTGLLDVKTVTDYINNNPRITNKTEYLKLIEPGTKVTTEKRGDNVYLTATNGNVKVQSPAISESQYLQLFPKSLIYAYPEFFIAQIIASK